MPVTSTSWLADQVAEGEGLGADAETATLTPTEAETWASASAYPYARLGKHFARGRRVSVR